MTDEKGARLVVLEGELGERVFLLGEDGLQIGRTSDCVIRLPRARVSRRHCTIETAAEGWRVRDLGSRNGTFVNGVPVRQQTLRPGDRITVAEWTFLFLAEEAPRAVAVEASDELLLSQPTETLSVDAGHYFDPGRLVEAGGRSGQLEALLRLARCLGEVRSLEELAGAVLPLALEAIPAERAILYLEVPGLEPQTLAARRDAEGIEPAAISSTLRRRTVQERLAVASNRVATEEELSQLESLDAGSIRALLCVPLLAEPTRALGLLYLDSAAAGARFDRRQLELLTALAGLVAPHLHRLRHLGWLQAVLGASLDSDLIGQSAAMRRLLSTVARVAPSDSTVLLRGESGTGKELVARALHRQSTRAGEAFVALNCANFSESLLESELFGHERGAFTGAVQRKAGKLEVADRGTLFLDEVGELPVALQARLLRVLEHLEFERLGGTETIRCDLRLLAATHRDLERALVSGGFRQDLFYRLNVIEIELPPLRERIDDIPLLANHFLLHHCNRLERPPLALSDAALELLLGYSWPGNVRELSNVLERGAVLAEGEWIKAEDLPAAIRAPASEPEASERGRYQEVLRQTRCRLVLEAVRSSGGHLTAAAAALGLSPNYLHRLIRNLGLRRRVDEAIRSSRASGESDPAGGRGVPIPRR